MKVYALIILGILFSPQLFAQYDNANLLVQSPDGKTVKLVWFFKSWSKDFTGFDIKRKEGLQNWVKLNNEPIIPGIAYKKNLLPAESDKVEESRIKAKLFKLLQSKQLRETSDTAMLRELNNDDNALREISNMISHDFDIALICGFAYVDHTVTNKTDYQYGVFITGTDKMLDSVKWNYGQIPDLNAVTEITSKSTAMHNGIEVIWNADINRMRGGDIAGFNIYREGIRLNSSPVMAANNKDISEFMWYDKSANNNIPNQYSISGESLFGIEGIIKSYTYKPADHPDEYKKPEVTEINSLGYYFKEGISVKWAFPREFEKFIKGFYVEKDNIPRGYKQVYSLLDPSSRAFIDKTESPVTGYISFKVTAVYNDKTSVPGIQRLYNYFPVREPPQPQNVSAKSVPGDKKTTINLSWDPAINGDSLTDYYKVYLIDPVTYKVKPVNEKPVRSNTYAYVINHGDGALYKFCVTSISKFNTESPVSDTVSVLVPRLETTEQNK